jgi:DNA-binding MarR family transcriptional regulator
MPSSNDARRRRGPTTGTAHREASGIETEPALDFMRLMWAVDHELQRVSKRMIGRLGLTAPQRLALRLIGRQPGLPPGVLAGLLHLHPGTVTGIVRRLEAAGLISRVRSEGDTRRMHLELTAKGHALNRRRKGTVEAAVVRLLESTSGHEVTATSRVLKMLAEELARE